MSNAQVESYFSTFKESTLERRTNLRPAEVIVSLYRGVQIQLKADKFGVCQVAKNRKGKAKDMNVEETWGKKKAQKKQRSVYFSRLDKCDVKRLGAKPNVSKTESSHPQLTSNSPPPMAISPKLPSTSPKSRFMDSESPPRFFDNCSFVPTNLQTQTNEIFGNLPNAVLPLCSPKTSASKPAKSFCGRNIVDEQDCWNDRSVTSLFSQSMSPCNIFSSVRTGELFDNLIKEKEKNGSEEINEKINGRSTRFFSLLIAFSLGNILNGHVEKQLLSQKKADTSLFPLAHSSDRYAVIGDCSLPWPAFEIKRKCFRGLDLSYDMATYSGQLFIARQNLLRREHLQSERCSLSAVRFVSNGTECTSHHHELGAGTVPTSPQYILVG